jgi:hypothetical protein
VIDVQLHNLVLGVVTFDLKRENPLVDLSRKRLFFREEEVLSELLRKGGSTFNLIGG